MEFEEFCERVNVVVLDALPEMYEETKEESWPKIEAVLRENLRLKSGLRTRMRRNKDYMALLNSEGQQLYEELRRVRRKIAIDNEQPAYTVFSNRTLFEMSRQIPFTMEELQSLFGVGKINSAQYGQSFLDAIHAFSNGVRTETCSEEFLEKGEEGYPLLFSPAKAYESRETERIAAGKAAEKATEKATEKAEKRH